MLAVLVAAVLYLLFDLKVGKAEKLIGKLENSPLLDGLEWLGKEVVGSDVLKEWNGMVENFRRDQKEAFNLMKQSMDKMQGITERALDLLAKVTDTETPAATPEELLDALKRTAEKHGAALEEIPRS